MDTQAAPQLAGIHHLKLPVTALSARPREWYRTRLGYRVQAEFVEHGQLMGYGLTHPDGGPPFALRLDPERARAAAGFDRPHLHDPDGHEIRFYTLQHHTDLDPDAVAAINDPRETAEWLRAGCHMVGPGNEMT